MKADTKFDSPIDEENMSKDKLYRHSMFLRWSFLFSVLKILNYLTFSSKFEATLSLILLSCLGSGYYISTIRQTKLYQIGDVFRLRLILEAYVLAFTIMKINIISAYSIEYLVYFFVEEFLYNFALNISIQQSCLFYFIHTVVIFCTYGSPGSWFIMRFVKIS